MRLLFQNCTTLPPLQPQLITSQLPHSHHFAPNPPLFPKHPRLLTENRAPISLIKATMASTTETDSRIKPFSVLFVCLGNICRSPAAEGVFRDLVMKRGLDSKFNIDSAGTIDYHEGNQADARMRAASKRRGVEITSISRPIRPTDFIDFDIILAMDRQNKEDIFSAFERWMHKHNQPLPADAANKVRLMCSYCKKHGETEVPDPYYGGAQGFEQFLQEADFGWSDGTRGVFIPRTIQQVLDILEDACESLLESIVAENPSILDK